MAYNTKPVVTDKDGNPISQYYNPATNQYEPVEGSGGGNKVVLYNADGTENNDLSLIPILDKLSQLVGTVIDEETRKSNELQRITLYNQISQMLANGELKGDKGDIGLGLEYDWNDSSLGVRVEGEGNYIYVNLKGPKGDKGETGNIDNLNAQHIEDALGYVPADEDVVGMLENLTTEEKANLVSAINEVKAQSNEIVTVELPKKANKTQETWKNLTLLNGWQRLETIRYRKDGFGNLQFQGSIYNGVKTAGTIIAELPVGYRPVTPANVTGITFARKTGAHAPIYLGINILGEIEIRGNVDVLTYVSLGNISIPLE